MNNILDFGAVSDGKTVCTKAIQAAVDACANAGGGTVIVPAGTFVTGTIWLKSHVELHLEMGALLEASLDLDDFCTDDSYVQNTKSVREQWNGAHLIVAVEQDDVALTGPGTIDGNAEFFFEDPFPPMPRHWLGWFDGIRHARDKERLRPGQMVVFCECTNVRIANLNLRNSTCWTVFLHGCTDVIVTGLNIKNRNINANTDGIDIDCCDSVTVSDCVIHTGDDAITLRGNPSKLKDKTRVCQNITVTNCVLDCAVCGFRIGVGQGTIRHAAISNLTMKRVCTAFLFQSAYTAPSTGPDISDIAISNIQMHCVAFPVRIVSGAPTATSQIKNINIDGMYGRCHGACQFIGSELTQPKHIMLRNVDLFVEASPVKLSDPSEYPSELFKFDHVKDVTLDNVRVTWEDDAEPTWKCTVSKQDCDVDIRSNCVLPEPHADNASH